MAPYSLTKGCHAKWQWLMNTKRSIKFKFINCMLKLNSEMITKGGFPHDDALRPHIRDIRAELRREAAAIELEGAIAPGYRNDFMYRERFNLASADVDLLRQELHHGPSKGQTFESSREVYLRNLLQPYKLYAFMGIQRTYACFYVAENKSFAGKDTPGEGEATGRFLSVAWLEATRELDEGVFVQPVNPDTLHLELNTYTVAELLRVAGHFLPIRDRESAKEVEVRYESEFLDFSLRVFADCHVATKLDLRWTSEGGLWRR